MRKILLMAALGVMTLNQVQAQGEKSGVNLSKGMSAMEMPQSSLRTSEGDSWLDHAADSYAGGMGTEADPYLIATPEQLAKLCLDSQLEPSGSDELPLIFEGVYFKQTADIDLSSRSVSGMNIGEYAIFAGVYDGNGFSIKGYSFQNKTMEYKNVTLGFGLFLNSQNAVIKNVTMEDYSIKMDYSNMENGIYRISPLISYASNTTVENCRVSGTIVFKGKGKTNSVYVGGIAGVLTDNSTINNCHAEGTISLGVSLTNSTEGNNFVCAGGIVSDMTGAAKISNCMNKSNISVEATGTSEAGVIVRSGGILAWAENVQILNCANTGDLNAKSGNTVNDASWVQAGGMIACVNKTANLANCWNAAKITSEGGFVDQPAGPFACYKGEKFSTRNCSYDRKLLVIEGDDYPQAYETAFMQSEEFVKMLNQALPDGCLFWRYVEGDYPVIDNPEITDPTAVETIETAKVSFYTQAGGLVIMAQEPMPVTVYTFQGVMRISRLIPDGTTTISLPEGLYILKLGNESHKIKVRR